MTDVASPRSRQVLVARAVQDHLVGITDPGRSDENEEDFKQDIDRFKTFILDGQKTVPINLVTSKVGSFFKFTWNEMILIGWIGWSSTRSGWKVGDAFDAGKSGRL